MWLIQETGWDAASINNLFDTDEQILEFFTTNCVCESLIPIEGNCESQGTEFVCAGDDGSGIPLTLFWAICNGDYQQTMYETASLTDEDGETADPEGWILYEGLFSNCDGTPFGEPQPELAGVQILPACVVEDIKFATSPGTDRDCDQGNGDFQVGDEFCYSFTPKTTIGTISVPLPSYANSITETNGTWSLCYNLQDLDDTKLPILIEVVYGGCVIHSMNAFTCAGENDEETVTAQVPTETFICISEEDKSAQGLDGQPVVLCNGRELCTPPTTPPNTDYECKIIEMCFTTESGDKINGVLVIKLENGIEIDRYAEDYLGARYELTNITVD